MFLIKDVFHPLIPPVIDQGDFMTRPAWARELDLYIHREMQQRSSSFSV